MIEKRELDLLIARNTGVPQKVVTRVTTELVELIRHKLAVEGRVRLKGFGVFRLYSVEGPNIYTGQKARKFRVGFSQSRMLRGIIQRHRR